jgi:hypothetical protein
MFVVLSPGSIGRGIGAGFETSTGGAGGGGAAVPDAFEHPTTNSASSSTLTRRSLPRRGPSSLEDLGRESGELPRVGPENSSGLHATGPVIVLVRPAPPPATTLAT